MVTGAGEFWRDAPYRALTIDPFPCRDQRMLFRREIAWVRRCARTLAECPEPRCMQAISLDQVIAAAADLRRLMAARPTIVQINLSPTLGGAEVYTAFLSRALAQRGWPTRVLVDAKAKFWRDSNSAAWN